MPRIFISYRRADSRDVTGRIYDHLVASFGRSNVFKDIDSIPLGSDFLQVIGDHINRSDVVLVIIGAQWATAIDRSGKQRLADPTDTVRCEVELALKEKKRIIPVLVKGASMPGRNQVPTSLNPILTINAATVRGGRDFRNDVHGLFQCIDPHRKLRRAFFVTLTLGVLAGVFGTAISRFSQPESTKLEELDLNTVGKTNSPKRAQLDSIETAPTPPPPLRTESRGVPVIANPHLKFIDHVLDSRDLPLEFVDNTLSEVIAYLSDLTNLEMSFEMRALDEAKIDPFEERTTIDLTGTPLRSAIQKILEGFDLTYVIQDNTLVVTTVEVAYLKTDVRLYDVSDLFARRFDTEELKASIQGNTSGLWRARDKFGGDISVNAANVLEINCPPQVHFEIESYLNALRAIQAQKEDNRTHDI